jgi:hypothetical protein
VHEKKTEKKKKKLKPNYMVPEKMQKRARFGARRNAEKKWCTNIFKKKTSWVLHEKMPKKNLVPKLCYKLWVYL